MAKKKHKDKKHKTKDTPEVKKTIKKKHEHKKKHKHKKHKHKHKKKDEHKKHKRKEKYEHKKKHKSAKKSDQSKKKSEKQSDNFPFDSVFGRIDTSKFADEQKTIPLRTTVIINQKKLEEHNADANIDWKMIDKGFHENIIVDFADVHRRVVEILDVSENGSPKKVKVDTPTDSRKILTRHGSNGVLSFFSNKTNVDLIDQGKPFIIKNIEDFNKSAIVKKVHDKATPPKQVKTQSIEITKESLEEGAKQRKKNGNKRIMPQNQIMNGAATAYYQAAEKSENAVKESENKIKENKNKFKESKEWTHLVADSLHEDKKEAAKACNLAVAPKNTNTAMIGVESNIKKSIVSNDTIKKITLNVEAKCVDNTHIANQIGYYVDIKYKKEKKENKENIDKQNINDTSNKNIKDNGNSNHVKLPFNFSCGSETNQPHCMDTNYTDRFFKEVNNKNNRIDDQKKSSNHNSNPAVVKHQ